MNNINSEEIQDNNYSNLNCMEDPELYCPYMSQYPGYPIMYPRYEDNIDNMFRRRHGHRRPPYPHPYFHTYHHPYFNPYFHNSNFPWWLLFFFL